MVMVAQEEQRLRAHHARHEPRNLHQNSHVRPNAKTEPRPHRRLHYPAQGPQLRPRRRPFLRRLAGRPHHCSFPGQSPRHQIGPPWPSRHAQLAAHGIATGFSPDARVACVVKCFTGRCPRIVSAECFSARSFGRTSCVHRRGMQKGQGVAPERSKQRKGTASPTHFAVKGKPPNSAQDEQSRRLIPTPPQ